MATDREIRFESRMSDSDALMWNIEKDPLLRSTILVVWLLDGSPDRARLEDKIERATRAIPRLRQHVVSNPASIAPPRWEADPSFDLRYHVRWQRAPGAGTVRDVLDFAGPVVMSGFDRARPLWELYVLEGLEGGRAALVMKLHHSLSDGVGLVRMTEAMVERKREPGRDPGPMPALPDARVLTQGERFWDALGHEWRRQLGRMRRAANAATGNLARTLRDPAGAAREAADAAASVGRMLQPVSEPLSPLWRNRSLSLRFDALTFATEKLRAAAKLADGKLNDAFVAGVAAGLRLYHEAHGANVRELRMTMPINVREGDTERLAGNQFVPARFAVPVGIADARERMIAIRALVAGQRAEPALAMLDDVSGLLNRLPAALATSLFGSMLKGVDFVTSNVPGPRFEVFLSGAKLDAVFGFGPLTGSALNVTLFSYVDRCHLGIASDPSAIPDPELLVQCLKRGFDQVLAGA
jgi:WS/DGAT/MGAT family acyltransferase